MAHITSSAVGTAVKQPGPKAEHLHPSSSEVKNGWNCTHIPPVDLYGMCKDSFICRKLGEFYVHGSVHCESMSVIVQQDATVCSSLLPANWYTPSQQQKVVIRFNQCQML